MKSALVTGAAGFIGSHLVRALLDRGNTVLGLDDLTTGRRANLDGVIEHEAFEFIEADIRSPEVCRHAVEGVDVVFHQAALPSVLRSVEDPRASTETNCLGTANLLVAARDSSVDSVVVASSSSVYGSATDLPKHEGMCRSPESPYALSKYFTEELAIQSSELYGLNTVALRYFNVFGPRQDPTGDYAAVIPKFIKRMLNGDRPVVYGDGEQSRDFTYIENVVLANVRAVESGVSGEVFNVGCGDRVTVNDLIVTLNEILGSELEPIYDDPRAGDVRHSQADVTKLRDVMGFEPTVQFREGLERTVAWFA